MKKYKKYKPTFEFKKFKVEFDIKLELLKNVNGWVIILDKLNGVRYKFRF